MKKIFAVLLAIVFACHAQYIIKNPVRSGFKFQNEGGQYLYGLVSTGFPITVTGIDKTKPAETYGLGYSVVAMLAKGQESQGTITVYPMISGGFGMSIGTSKDDFYAYAWRAFGYLEPL